MAVPYKLQCICPEYVVRIFIAVGLDTESRSSDGVEGELAVHLLGLQDLARHSGRLQDRLDIGSALVNVRDHQLELPAGEDGADNGPHLERLSVIVFGRRRSILYLFPLLSRHVSEEECEHLVNLCVCIFKVDPEADSVHEMVGILDCDLLGQL